MTQLMPLLLLQSSLTESAGQGANAIVGKLITLGIGLAILVALAALVKTGSRRYRKVPPEKALVIFGGGETDVVTGGARFIMPLFRDFYELDLTNFTVPLTLKAVPNADRIPVSVLAFAICRISNNKEMLKTAARTFGTKRREEVVETVKNALEGHLRVVIGRITMEVILSDREHFNKEIQTAAASELGNIGCEIVILNIQEVTDPHGYIDALGRPKAAEVRAEAAIKEAEQKKRETIETSTATREAETTRADNEGQVAEAERKLRLKKAEVAAEVNAADARAAQAGPKAEAEASQGVLVAKVAAEEAKTQAETKLQDAVKERTKAQLDATVLQQAEAEKKRQAIAAQGEGDARNIAANAAATAAQKEADGEASKIRTVGLANAEMTAKNGLAAADAKKANLLAEADGETAKAGARKALLEAEAAGQLAQAAATKALLLAQAEGALKLNEAYSKLSPEAKQLFLATRFMETGPALIAATGDAFQKAMEPIAQALVSSLGSIDNITVFDSGSGKGGALDRAVSVGPDLFFRLINNLKANGLYDGAVALLKPMGVDLTAFDGSPAIEAGAVDVTGTPDKPARVSK